MSDSNKLEQAIRQELTVALDPITREPWVNSLTSLTVAEGEARLHFDLGYPHQLLHSKIQQQLSTLLQPILAQSTPPALRITLNTQVSAHESPSASLTLPGVKNIIAVASGKGGVGKSTTAVNLALALHAEGGRVGILDADIYGPSIPMMLGIDHAPAPEAGQDSKRLPPAIAHGLQLMSIGFLVEKDSPMIWRGPMATGMLEQLIRQTLWQDLDYLIVDMPPGTGDIHLTLAQRVPLTGVVVVTTPQDIALIDAKRAVKMFEKVHIPILGLVENMSIYCCPQCGHEAPIFGSGGAQKMADDYVLEVLGHLPLALPIREQMDAGAPPMAISQHGASAANSANPANAKQHALQQKIQDSYLHIAHRVMGKVAVFNRQQKNKFPKIVME